MRTVDIPTTQKVTIEYELASLRDRLLSFFIDSVIIWSSILLLAVIFTPSIPDAFINYFRYLVLLPIALFYTLVSEIVGNGQSWGKKVTGIKVVHLSGRQSTMMDYTIRWIFRLVDIYFSFGVIALVLISSSEKSQRLGGILSNSAVVKLTPARNYALRSLLSIQSVENYEPHYPMVKNFSETRMVLIKKSLDRAKKFNNEAHKEVIDMLASDAATQLNLTSVPIDKTKFLETLIQDYIVLTR